LGPGGVSVPGCNFPFSLDPADPPATTAGLFSAGSTLLSGARTAYKEFK
jgi:hypothetical protein